MSENNKTVAVTGQSHCTKKNPKKHHFHLKLKIEVRTVPINRGHMGRVTAANVNTGRA